MVFWQEVMVNESEDFLCSFIANYSAVFFADAIGFCALDKNL